MALVKLSGLVSDIRGKLNGSQFSHSGSGLVLQNKCQQKRIGSAAQYQWRQNFKKQANDWNLLSPSEVEANNAAALNYPYLDKFGDLRYYTGYQLLLRSNLNLVAGGFSPIDVVPSTPPVPVVFTFFFLGDSSYDGVNGYFNAAFVLDISNPLDYSLQYFLSPPVSTAISNYTGEYLLAFTSPNASVGVDLYDFEIPYFASWAFNRQIFVSVKVIHIASGVQVGGNSGSFFI